MSINKHLKLREGLTRATFGTIPSHSHTLLWFLLLVTLRWDRACRAYGHGLLSKSMPYMKFLPGEGGIPNITFSRECTANCLEVQGPCIIVCTLVADQHLHLQKWNIPSAYWELCSQEEFTVLGSVLWIIIFSMSEYSLLPCNKVKEVWMATPSTVCELLGKQCNFYA